MGSAATAAATANSAGFYRRALRRAELAADLPARVPAGDPADGRRRVGRGRRPRCRSTGGTTTSAASTATTALRSPSATRSTSRSARRCRRTRPRSTPARSMLNQFVANVDISRPCRGEGIGRAVNVAFGAEARRENYRIHGRRARFVSRRRRAATRPAAPPPSAPRCFPGSGRRTK